MSHINKTFSSFFCKLGFHSSQLYFLFGTAKPYLQPLQNAGCYENIKDILPKFSISLHSHTDLVSNVMDGDVMHCCSVTLKQSVEISPTMSETQKVVFPYKFHFYRCMVYMYTNHS